MAGDGRQASLLTRLEIYVNASGWASGSASKAPELEMRSALCETAKRVGGGSWSRLFSCPTAVELTSL